MNQIAVSIIIVNYNSSELVKGCVVSILNNVKRATFEIIIVDNNSKESIEERLSFFKESEIFIKLIRLNENIGFGRANNEGLKEAKGRNILFLNPDTLLLNDAVTILSDYLDEHPNVAACGGNLFDAELKPTRSFRRCYPSISWLLGSTFLYDYFEIFLYEKNRFFNRKGKCFPVAYIVGADLMVTRHVLDECGGFDPAFFMYYEEIELCHRFSAAGYKIMSVPAATIQHLEGKTSNNSERKAKMLYASSQSYYRLSHSLFYYCLMKVVFFFMILTRIGICFFLNRRNSLQYWKIQFLCLINGVK